MWAIFSGGVLESRLQEMMVPCSVPTRNLVGWGWEAEGSSCQQDGDPMGKCCSQSPGTHHHWGVQGPKRQQDPVFLEHINSQLF